MSVNPIYGPMLLQIGLTLVVVFWLAYARFSFIGKYGLAKVRDEGFPTRAVNASDNFKNQFEVPVLFYALCIFFAEAGEVSGAVLFFAWAFVLLRYLHALVQLTSNIIFPWRFGFFFSSTICVLVLAVIASIQAVS